LSGVDPDKEGFYEFRGQEIEVECEHESNEKGGAFERWGLVSSKPKLEDTSQLRFFDRLLNAEPKSEPVSNSVGITDEDVAF
jgi:hypothetical protein